MATTKNTTEPILADTDRTLEASGSPLKKFAQATLKKISQRLQIVRENSQDAWADVDAEKRATLLKILIAVICGVAVVFISWKLFFRGNDTVAPAIAEIISTEPLANDQIQITDTQINTTTTSTTNNDNLVLPALNTGDLESWSGLRKDSYEMKKRGQLKTLPAKILESVSDFK